MLLSQTIAVKQRDFISNHLKLTALRPCGKAVTIEVNCKRGHWQSATDEQDRDGLGCSAATYNSRRI